MGFLVKKLLILALMPLVWVLVLGLLALVLNLKNRRRAAVSCALAGLILLLVSATAPLSNALLEPLEQPYRAAVLPAIRIERVVVLGGGTSNVPDLPLTSRLSDASLHRLLEGIRVWRQTQAAKLVLSGGVLFDSKSEAELMAELAIELGVPEAALELDRQSQDTAEQALWLQQRLPDRQPFLLVTSASHMTRALSWIRATGLKPIPWAAQFRIQPSGHWAPNDFAVGSRYLQRTEIALYEWLGLAWFKLQSRP